MQTDTEDAKAQGDSQSENGEKKSETEEMEVSLQQTINPNCWRFEIGLRSFENWNPPFAVPLDMKMTDISCIVMIKVTFFAFNS